MTRLTDKRIDTLIDAMPERPGRLALRELARAIEAELAQQAEPVAQFRLIKGGREDGADLYVQADIDGPENIPLYIAPLPSAPDTVQVPREPTMEMESAFEDAQAADDRAQSLMWDERFKAGTAGARYSWLAGYRAMIEAAPKSTP